MNFEFFARFFVYFYFAVQGGHIEKLRKKLKSLHLEKSHLGKQSISILNVMSFQSYNPTAVRQNIAFFTLVEIP